MAVQSHVDTDNLLPRVRNILNEFQKRFPEATITSGYRDPNYNKNHGGAGDSRHMHQDAFDFKWAPGTSDVTKAQAVNFLRVHGAGGLGTYNKTGDKFHADWRQTTPVAWGPDTHATSLNQTPDWFQKIAADHRNGVRPDPRTIPQLAANYDPKLSNDPRLSGVPVGTPGRMTPEQFLKTNDVSSFPAGMRNNNPGNLKFSGSDWQKRNYPGMVGPSVNTDEGTPQIVFNSPQAGMQAMSRLIQSKTTSGMNTVYDLINNKNGWTPTPAGPGAAANIAKTMGVDPNAKLDFSDPKVFASFQRALITQEHGEKGSLYHPLVDAAVSRQLGLAAPADSGTGTRQVTAPTGIQPLASSASAGGLLGYGGKGFGKGIVPTGADTGTGSITPASAPAAPAPTLPYMASPRSLPAGGEVAPGVPGLGGAGRGSFGLGGVTEAPAGILGGSTPAPAAAAPSGATMAAGRMAAGDTMVPTLGAPSAGAFGINGPNMPAAPATPILGAAQTTGQNFDSEGAVPMGGDETLSAASPASTVNALADTTAPTLGTQNWDFNGGVGTSTTGAPIDPNGGLLGISTVADDSTPGGGFGGGAGGFGGGGAGGAGGVAGGAGGAVGGAGGAAGGSAAGGAPGGPGGAAGAAQGKGNGDWQDAAQKALKGIVGLGALGARGPLHYAPPVSTQPTLHNPDVATPDIYKTRDRLIPIIRPRGILG
ncbi:hypothetical protein FF100_21990 [Methylobacterium terricola]|uniref:Peptidase M15A C-terminal domain-containing protein n=1 Tax=Methylobacterium terricola TaxID=2583531 RepID=A0A5C4LDN0_9HYPH|nr:D-Ala-D-Ala carboxypeptidase family metallohydrolase [Methylobacterium terricola]TNC10824.1 hypothetical protein FF100_21990 [Methylobacterium terricola]